MKNIRRILIVLLALLLSVTATYSWFFYKTNKAVRTLNVDLRNNVKVYDDDGFTLSVYREKDGDYVQAIGANALSFEGMVPGDTIPFQIRITNSSGNSRAVNLIFAEISCTYTGNDESIDSEAILNYMYLIVTPGDGYTASANTDLIIPETRIIKFSDTTLLSGDPGHYILKIYDSENDLIPTLTVPNTGGDSTVNLNCRLWFDIEAIGCEDFVFNIGKIVITV